MKTKLLKTMRTLLVMAGLCIGVNQVRADISVQQFGSASTTSFTFTSSQTGIKWGSSLTLKGVVMTFGGGTYTSSQTASNVSYTDDCWIYNSSNGGILGTFTPNNDGTKVESSGITVGAAIPTHGSTYKFVVTEKGSLEIKGKTGGQQKYYLVAVDNDNKITSIVGSADGPAQNDITATYNNLEAGTYCWFFLGSSINGGRFTLKTVSFTLASLSEDYLSLKSAYETAKAFYDASVEGTTLFCYSATDRSTFNTVLTGAKTVLDGTPTDDECKTKTTEVNTALATFKAAQVKPNADKCYYIQLNGLYLNLNSDQKWSDAKYTVNMPVLSNQPYAVKFEAKDDTENAYYIKNVDGSVYIYKQSADNYATALGTKNTGHYFLPEAVSGGGIKFRSSWQNTYYFASGTPAHGGPLGVSSSNVRSFTVSEAPQAAATASVTAAKWASFVAPFAVELPESVTAYTCTYTDGTLTTTATGSQTVAANTPVLLYSENTYSNEFKGYAQSFWSGQPASNALVGTLSAITLPTDGTVYLLQKQGDVVGWYKYSEGTISSTANRAYLKIPAGSAARQFMPLFGDNETTDIDAIDNGLLIIDNYYNLNGQRVSQPARGLYIVGGKKVMVK